MVNITAETSRKISQFKQKREADEIARLQTKAVPYPVPILFIAEPFLIEKGVDCRP